MFPPTIADVAALANNEIKKVASNNVSRQSIDLRVTRSFSWTCTSDAMVDRARVLS
jgi:hypothetical protein